MAHAYKVKIAPMPDGKEWQAVISSPNGLFGQDADVEFPNWIAAVQARNEKKVRKEAEEWCEEFEGIERWGQSMKLGVPESEVPMPEYSVEFVN